jgi:hypothetical protein
VSSSMTISITTLSKIGLIERISISNTQHKQQVQLASSGISNIQHDQDQG